MSDDRTFTPKPYYCPDSDSITVYIADREAYAKYAAPGVVVYRATDNNDVVGFKITDIKDLLLEGIDQSATDSLPQTGAALLQSLQDNGFIGMWADREDMKDGLQFARQLRENGLRQDQGETKP